MQQVAGQAPARGTELRLLLRLPGRRSGLFHALDGDDPTEYGVDQWLNEPDSTAAEDLIALLHWLRGTPQAYASPLTASRDGGHG